MVYSTRLHVYTRASLTDILARKSARVGQVGGLPRVPRQADFRARICSEVSEDVRVGVCVGVGPMEFKLFSLCGGRCVALQHKLSCKRMENRP